MNTKHIIPFPKPKAESGNQPIIHGRITAQDDESWIVRLQDGRVIRAHRASGCFVLPEIGDVALIYAGPGKAAYVLTILEKASPEAVLAFEDKVQIQAGRVELAGTESLSLSAPDVDVQGVRGRVGFLNFSFSAGDVLSRVRKLTSFTEHARHTVRSLVQNLRDSLRRVESMETVEAASLHTKVDKSWTLKTGSAAVRAEQDVDIDGEHINLG